MKSFCLFVLILAPGLVMAQDTPPIIEHIDIYGLRRLTEAEVLNALPISEGDPMRANQDELADALAAELGVISADIAQVCCSDTGGAVAYVGIEETPAPTLSYNPAPQDDISLPAEVVETAAAFNEAVFAAVLRGEASEDISQGHSLGHTPEVRTLQEQFIGYADKYWDVLIDVLQHSVDGKQRAIAALVAAYTQDKRDVVPHLVHAALDADAGVRNDATRALAIIANFANENPQLGIEYATDPFITMLGSVSQTDRNKGSWLLTYATQNRDPMLMSRLRTEALMPAVEICHWHWDGHSMAGCTILERALGLPDSRPPYDAASKRALTQASLPFLSSEERRAAQRLVQRSDTPGD